MNKTLLVDSQPPSVNTRMMRDALLIGAREASDGITINACPALQAEVEDVVAAQAVILHTTENLGYMSGGMKDFFDRIYYPCLEKTQGLPFATVVRAGHDGTGTCRAVDGITTGLRWRSVQETLLCRGAFRSDFVDRCRELGAAMAVGLESGIF